MPVYKKKRRHGVRWNYDGQYRGQRYWSAAVYKTEAQAKRAEREHLARIDEELDNPKTDITFYELCQRRLDYLKAAATPKYYSQNRQTFRRAIAFFGPDTPVSAIAKHEVQDFLVERANELVENGFDMHGVNKDIRHLKALFYYGSDEIEATSGSNPLRKIKFFAVSQSVKYIPPDSDIAKVLLIADKFQQTYLTVIKNTLARSIEINRLRVEDVDFENQRIRLWTKKSKTQDLTPRWVGMNSELLTTLKAWFKIRYKRNPLVFYNSIGGELEYQRWLPELCEKAGVKPFGFHSLRHRGATKLLKERNIDIHSLMEILGHNNLSTTQRYIQTLKEADGNYLEGI